MIREDERFNRNQRDGVDRQEKGLRAVGKFNEAIFDVEGHRVLANRVNDQSATTYGLGYLRGPTISKGGRQLKRPYACRKNWQ
jgi:hypothetical protein